MSQPTNPENEVNGSVERAVPGTSVWKSLHADHLARYYYAAGLVAGRRVLDAGTGPGYGAALLKVSGAIEVEAVDVDESALKWAECEYGATGVRFILDDCETLSRVTGQFDVICSFENLEHLRNPDAFLRAAAQRLAPGGMLICSSPDRAATGVNWVNGRPGNPHHEMEWYADEFQSLLSMYFRGVEIKRQVESVAAVSRRNAARNLHNHLLYVWANPFFRISRMIGSLFGRRPVWGDVTELSVPSVGDYPIVPAAIASAVGRPWCLYAICREPIV